MDTTWNTHVIVADDWDLVARLVSALDPDEVGRHPGVQFSQLNGCDHWTVAIGDSRVTVVGGASTAPLAEPVWLPVRALFWGAELAQDDGMATLRIEDGPAGPVAEISAALGSGRFDLPQRPVVAEVPGRDDLPEEVASLRIAAPQLMRQLRAAGRGPAPRPGVETPTRWTLGVSPEGLSVGVDWSIHGGTRATYAVPADVRFPDGTGPGRHTTATVDVKVLYALLGVAGDGSVGLRFLADGSVHLHERPVHAQLPALDTPSIAGGLDTLLAGFDMTQYSQGAVVHLDGLDVEVHAPNAKCERWHLRAELATDLPETVDLLIEVNQLNLQHTDGCRFSVLGPTLWASEEVDSVGALPAAIDRFHRAVVHLGPLVASLADPSAHTPRGDGG